MCQRRPYLLALLVLPLLVGLGRAETRLPTTAVGKTVPTISLRGEGDRVYQISEFKDKKFIVLVFLGTECPINNAYGPRLQELSQAFAPRGVQFLGVNANRHDTPAKVAEHARTAKFDFPVLKDVGNVVADQCAVRVTPEVVVLDADRVIRYQGRIDDQFGIGYRRAKPTRHDLSEALNELLGGKLVSQPVTDAVGCHITRVKSTPAAANTGPGTVTFSKDVARILQKNCQECHRPGQIGPMSLSTYDDAAAWADSIGDAVSDGRMPPWYADPKHGKFANDRSVSVADRETLLTWIRQGLVRGDDRDLPAPRQFPVGWTIGTPDVILSMPRAYAVPAQVPRHLRNGIPYKHFAVATNFTEDRWVEAAEVRSGAAGVVHHVLVYIEPPGTHFDPNDPNALVLCGTAPGDMPLHLRPGFAKKIPAGSKLIFQVHYTPNGVAQTDQSSVGLIFAAKPPRHQVETFPIHNPVFLIPPGAEGHQVDAWTTLEKDVVLLDLMPHMHLRGKDFRYEAIYPDGRTEVLLSVPRYQFQWQSVYRLAEPMRLPKGTKLHCTAHYDNSAKNLNNPDPTKAVYWGDQTWEEMMIGWIDYAVERDVK